MVSGMFWGAVFHHREEATAFLWDTLGASALLRVPWEAGLQSDNCGYGTPVEEAALLAPPQREWINVTLNIRFPNYVFPSVIIFWPTAFRSVLLKRSSLFSTAVFVIRVALGARVPVRREGPPKPVWSVADDACGVTETPVNLQLFHTWNVFLPSPCLEEHVRFYRGSWQMLLKCGAWSHTALTFERHAVPDP